MRLAHLAAAVTVTALTVTTLLVAGAGQEGRAGADPAVRAVIVRDADGELLAQAPLVGETFAVSYRNSIYRTLAEERYRVSEDGFTVVELAADQLAVLEEYYAVPGPVRPAPGADRREWVARPTRPAEFTDLTIAATELGERTLHVPGHPPVPLAPLVDDDPTVVLDVEVIP